MWNPYDPIDFVIVPLGLWDYWTFRLKAPVLCPSVDLVVTGSKIWITRLLIWLLLSFTTRVIIDLPSVIVGDLSVLWYFFFCFYTVSFNKFSSTIGTIFFFLATVSALSHCRVRFSFVVDLAVVSIAFPPFFFVVPGKLTSFLSVGTMVCRSQALQCSLWPFL